MPTEAWRPACLPLLPHVQIRTALFPRGRDKVQPLLRAEVQETHQTGVFVTHSIREAMDIGDPILVFSAPDHVAAEFSVQEALREYGEVIARLYA